jgi:hypothetical protein
LCPEKKCQNVFFNEAKALSIPLIKKEIKRLDYKGASEAPDTKVHSRGIKALKYLAPAIP